VKADFNEVAMKVNGLAEIMKLYQNADLPSDIRGRLEGFTP